MIEAFDRQSAQALQQSDHRGHRSAVLVAVLAAAAIVGVASADAYSGAGGGLTLPTTAAGQCGTLLYVGSAGNGVDLWAPGSSDYAFASGRATIRTGGAEVPVLLSMMPRRGRIQTQSFDSPASPAFGDQVQICQ